MLRQLEEDSPEAIASLPVLKLEDVAEVRPFFFLSNLTKDLLGSPQRLTGPPWRWVSQAPPEIPIQVSVLGSEETGVHLLTHDLPTSGIVYFEMAFSLADLSLEHLRYLPLFCRLLVEGGTSSLSAEKLQHLIGANTGGLAASTEVMAVPNTRRKVADKFDAMGFVVLRGKVSQVQVLLSCVFS